MMMGTRMMKLDVSLSLDRRIPALGQWLSKAACQVDVIALDAKRQPGSIRILGVDEIGHATHRDILIDFRPGAPRLVAAAAGLPARIAFGEEDARFAVALIAEMARPAGLPAVGDEASARLMQLADRIARSDATVLIEGDTGTGKEGLARLIHARSPRADRDFIAINCAALPETMMEAMLFGHRKGSFTGAVKDKVGLFQAAEGGTLFLDEVADLPLHMQVKLLRAVQERAVRPVGAEAEQPVNVRIISATHKNLAALVAQGGFRQDLYYRLNVIEVRTPALRERREDIPLLTRAILARLAPANGLEVPPRLHRSALDALMAYDFPGNVRELENTLERALALSDGELIVADDLQLRPSRALAQDEAPATRGGIPAALDEHVEELEKRAIREALEKARWNKTKAAELLGMSFRSLRYRIKKLGIE